MPVNLLAALSLAYSPPPIIGGQGELRFEYRPDRLVLPKGASLRNAHGLVTDAAGRIYFTYEHGGNDTNCLVRWEADGTGARFLTAGGKALCEGVPHGLQLSDEEGHEFLYHANNEQKLTKTRLDGSIVWQRSGNFGQDPRLPYRPTWFATPPGPFVYLCDGYGSNRIYAFDKQSGAWAAGRVWGGKGGREQHGNFSTNHGCTYDVTADRIAVSDRANSRIEFYDYGRAGEPALEYSHTLDLRGTMGGGSFPCNLRTYPGQGGRGISPDLSGPVAVLDAAGRVASVVNVSVLLGPLGHRHPHDAILLPSGDMAVAEWNPGFVTYWKRLPSPARAGDVVGQPDL